jgi:hypothetical protein
MFVNAHVDLFWTKSGTRACDVLKIMLDDGVTTSTELFQTYPGILENSYRGIVVDLPGSWSRNVVRFFFHRIKVPVIIVCSEPVKDMPYLYVDTTDPNETHAFFSQNRKYFPHFRIDDPRSFMDDFVRTGGILSQLMSKYRYGLHGMDEAVLDPYEVRTLSDAHKLISRGFEDVCSVGDLEWRARALDVCSFVDGLPSGNSVRFRTEELKDISITLRASAWVVGIRQFC